MPIPPGYSETLQTPKASRMAEAVWSFKAGTAGSSVVLPDGRCDLILRGTSEAPHSLVPVVTGPATTAYTVQYDKGDLWYGVRLRPDRARAVWGTRLRDAPDTVARGSAAQDIVPALAERWLGDPPLARLLQALPDHVNTAGSAGLTRALDLIHATGGRVRVERLATYLGWTARHLNRLFHAQVGLSVKTYIQLARFNRTLRLVCAGGVSLADAAFEGGYADHAHMTRAFRRFGGFAPTNIPAALDLPAVFHR